MAQEDLPSTRTIWQILRTKINNMFTETYSSISNTLPASLATKQDRVPVENLLTNSKDVVGAINEIYAMVTPSILVAPILSIGSGGTTVLNGTITPILGNNGYKIYASDTQNGTFTLLVTVDLNGTTFQETGLTTGQTRWYKGQTLGNGTTTHDSLLGTAYSGTTSSVIQLNAPTMGVVSPDSTSQITVQVSNVSTSALFLQLEYKQSVDSSWTTFSSTLARTITSQQVGSLTTNTSYDFRWTAIGNGTTILNSNPSNTGTATTANLSTKLTTPTPGVTSIVSQTVFAVSISNIDSRSRYVKMQYKRTSDTTWIDSTYKYGRYDSTGYLFGLDVLTQYDIRFIAIGNTLISDSDPSLVITGTTTDYSNKIYIDPTAAGGGTGTIASPFNGMPATGDMVADTSYLFKRGTTYSHTNKINVQVANVIIGAYGVGARPVINQTSNEDNIIGAGFITITDLELIAPTGESGKDGYQYSFANADGHINAFNCKIHGGGQCIRNLFYVATATSPITMKIIGCETYDTWSDAMFLQCTTSIEVAGCNIYNVNLSHPAGDPDDGDGIHTDNTATLWVHNNIVDHSSQPGKFCLLAGILTTGYGGNVLSENNTFIRSRTGTDETIFYSDYKSGTNIHRYNTYKNALIAFDTHSKDTQIYGNSFENIDNIYNCGADLVEPPVSAPVFYNNVVYNCGKVGATNAIIYGFGETLVCKNNIFSNITGKIFVNSNNPHVSDYNDFYLVDDMGDTSLGAHDITTNPQFVSPTTGDFTLQPTSPCKSTGVVIGGYTPSSNVDRGSGLIIP